MNVDLFQDNPSWKYYIYFLIPLCAVVGLGYAAFRYGPSVLAYVRSKRVLHDTESNEALLNDSTVLSWAAATGQIDTLTYVLGGHGTVESAQGNAEGYALIPAAMNGHVEAVRILIRDPHTKINVVDAAGATALHHASRRGFAEVVELLLSHRASLEVKDQADQTPLDWAIQGGDGESTALILRQKYSLPEEEGEPLQPSLHYAAISADLAIFDLLLQGGFNPYQRNNKGRIPLFSALESRNIDFFGHALEKIADRTSTDNYGFNLLHVAVEMDYVEAVKLLVQKVIPINQRSAGSLRTPLLCINAMPTNDTLEILKVLVEHNADVNMYDSSGNTLIHLLAKSPGNCSPLINFLADKGAKLDEINNMENTPHHLAAAVGNLEAIKALSRAPEGFNMRNGIRRKPIEVAASNGFLEIVMEIQKLDGTANVTSPSQEFDLRWSLIEEAIKTDDVEKLGSILRGWGGSHEREDEAFHLAILENAPQATSYLLKVGCKIELAASRLGQFNSSVLQLAIERKCQKTVPIILEAGVSVDGTDDYGWTCLHSAAQVDDFDAASRIAPIIFNKDQRDEMGWTALDLAWHWKHQRIFDLLHSGGEYLHPYDLRRTKYYPGCPFSSPPGVTGPIEVPAISR
jgi:ankyrin repeat protein